MSLDDIKHSIANIQARHRARPEMMRGMAVPYYRRGVMAIPSFKMAAGGDVARDARAQSLKLMNKAAQLPLDCFFYDLEDAAPDNPEFKPFAREFVVEALTTNDFGNRVVAYRPNNIRTAYFADDIVEVVSRAGHRLQMMVIPKSEHWEEVADVVTIVRDVQRLAGQTNTISMEVLIESPTAFLEAEKIAAIDGVSALVFGAWDFARTIGGRVTAEGWIHDQSTVRQLLPVIAAAHGKEAVDAVTGTLPIRPVAPAGMSASDVTTAMTSAPETLDASQFGAGFIDAVRKRHRAIELTRRDAEDARAIGYAAKWILHPDQIDAVHAAWTPSRSDALRALTLTADYARSALAGSGAEVDGDRLADKAVIGTEWWVVRAAINAGSLTDADVAATGFTFEQLLRTVVTHDNHSALR